MYKIGLVSISFRQHTAKEILAAMKKASLTHIEWGSDVHAPYSDIEKIKEISVLQKQYDITCCSYGTYFCLGVSPLYELEDYINAAKLLGTDVLRLWCGDKDSEEYNLKEKNSLFEECKKAANIAEKLGVTLCMECHNKTYTNQLNSALELIHAVNSPNFKMYWQPNQYRTLEENLNYAEKIAHHSEHIHVFNWEKEKRFPLAEAIDIWKKYLTKFNYNKTLLLEFMPDDNINSLQTEADCLRKIINDKC